MNGIRCFELLEDLSPGGTARAVLLKWNNGRYVRTAEEISVTDFVDTHGNRRDRGYAYYSPDSERWEALSGLFEQVAHRAAM